MSFCLDIYVFYFQTLFSSSSRNGTNGMNYLKGQPFFLAASFLATHSGLSLPQQSLTQWKEGSAIQRGGIISSIFLTEGTNDQLL